MQHKFPVQQKCQSQQHPPTGRQMQQSSLTDRVMHQHLRLDRLGLLKGKLLLCQLRTQRLLHLLNGTLQNQHEIGEQMLPVVLHLVLLVSLVVIASVWCASWSTVMHPNGCKTFSSFSLQNSLDRLLLLHQPLLAPGRTVNQNFTWGLDTLTLDLALCRLHVCFCR